MKSSAISKPFLYILSRCIALLDMSDVTAADPLGSQAVPRDCGNARRRDSCILSILIGCTGRPRIIRETRGYITITAIMSANNMTDIYIFKISIVQDPLIHMQHTKSQHNTAFWRCTAAVSNKEQHFDD